MDNLDDLDVNTAMWSIFMNVTLPSIISSWSRLHGEFTIYHESTLEVYETIVPSDWKVDRGSERNQQSDHD